MREGKRNRVARELTEYSFLDGRHPYVDIYKNMSQSEWFGSREIISNLKNSGIIIPRQVVRKGLEWMRKCGIVEHRIRELRPLKGFTAADVLRKITEGTGNLNTGVVVYEYRVTRVNPTKRFAGLIEWNRKKQLSRIRKQNPKPKWSKRRRLKPEEAMYVRINPDNMSPYFLAKMFGLTRSSIENIQSGKTYADINMKKYIPIREKIFSQIKTEHYQFLVDNNF